MVALELSDDSFEVVLDVLIPGVQLQPERAGVGPDQKLAPRRTTRSTAGQPHSVQFFGLGVSV